MVKKIEELEAKRDFLLYTVYNKITKRINNEKSKVWYQEDVQAIDKKYSRVYEILSGKINSLDFVICSLKSGRIHSDDVWNYQLTRALS